MQDHCTPTAFPNFVNGLFRTFLIDIYNRYRGPFTRKDACYRFADSARSAGYNGNFSREFHDDA